MLISQSSLIISQQAKLYLKMFLLYCNGIIQPQYKNMNVYDSKMKLQKREDFQIKTENDPEQKAAQKTSKKEAPEIAEDAEPQKKRQRKVKV